MRTASTTGANSILLFVRPHWTRRPEHYTAIFTMTRYAALSRWIRTKSPNMPLFPFVCPPLHQHRGISRELLRFAFSLVTEKGLRALHIDCLSINPGPMRLIDSLGFQRVGAIYYPEKDPRVRDYPFYCFEKVLA